MNKDTPSYYMPYDSDGADTGDETDDAGTIASDETEYLEATGLPSSEDPRIRIQQDPRYAILMTAGPSFNTSEKQLQYQEHAPGSNYMINEQVTNKSLLYENPQKTVQTSLFSIKSTNRDKGAYPSSSAFSIKLPRVYKNVTKFQLVQLSFPNFVNAITDISGFVSTIVQVASTLLPSSCISSCQACFSTQTASNTITFMEQGRVNPVNGAPLKLTASVPTGLYDGASLANELNKSMNTVPKFNIVSYTDFRDSFLQTKSVSSLLNIDSREYFPQTALTGAFIPTEKHAFISYYYPVLKEALASERASIFLDLLDYSEDEVRALILNQFLGLDSDVYYTLCSTNKPYLDNYRRIHTFEYHPINKYTWNFDQNNRQFKVEHESLHPTLLTDITQHYNSTLYSYITSNGYDLQSYNKLNSDYEETFFTLGRLQSTLQGALNMAGISLSPLAIEPLSAPMNVEAVSTLAVKTVELPYSEADILGGSGNNPYNIPYIPSREDFFPDQPFISEDGTVFTEGTSSSGVACIHVPAGKYALLRIRSPIRQAITVSTLPRPYKYRYPIKNMKSSSNAIRTLFTRNYSLIEDPLLYSMASSTIQPLNFPYGIDKFMGLDKAVQFSINVLKKTGSFMFEAPLAEPLDGDIVGHKYTIQISIQHIHGDSPFTVCIYNDFGFFTTDPSGTYSINKKQVCGNEITFTVSVYSGKKYYIRVTPNLLSFNNSTFSIYSWWQNTTFQKLIDNDVFDENVSWVPDTNDIINYHYTIVNDPMYNSILIEDLVQPKDNAVILTGQRWKGYDMNGISSDPVDYISMSDPAVRFDPLTGYIYSLDTIYDTSYNIYTIQPPTQDAREYKQVHWKQTHYIPAQPGDPIDTISHPTLKSVSATELTIPGYTYSIDGENGIELGNGVIGFTFSLTRGEFKIKSFCFKSAFLINEDPNMEIAHIRVFPTGALRNRPVQEIPFVKPVTILERISEIKDNTEIDGTWHLFEVDNEGYTVNGHDLPDGILHDKLEDLYSIVAFNSVNEVVNIVGLVGSYIPYPEYSTAVTSQVYPISGSQSIGDKYIVLPVSSENVLKNLYESAYEDSIPIRTSVLHYRSINIVEHAWQIFYPTYKLTLEKVSDHPNDVENQYDMDMILGHGIEYPKTQLFLYKDLSSFIIDTTDGSMGVWGNEKNYMYLGERFLGGYSRMSNIIVDCDYSYIAIRGYSPTEDYECLVRITMSGCRDCGIKTLSIVEDDVKGLGVETTMFTTPYLQSISTLDGLEFTNLVSSIDGYSTLSDGYFSTLSSIKNGTLQEHKAYIQTKYSTVLPVVIQDGFINGKSLPVLFRSDTQAMVASNPFEGHSGDCDSCCKIISDIIKNYYSCLPVETTINSLAYKLGFPIISISSFNIANTLGALGALQNFNVLMQINTEQSFNNMDIAMNEDYKVSNETTGQVRFIAAKILTAGLGANDIAQTVIQNPIVFSGTLGKLDKLTFNLLVDDDSLTPINKFFPFDFGFTEWDATFQIDEEIGQMDLTTVPTVKWNSAPY